MAAGNFAVRGGNSAHVAFRGMQIFNVCVSRKFKPDRKIKDVSVRHHPAFGQTLIG